MLYDTIVCNCMNTNSTVPRCIITTESRLKYFKVLGHDWGEARKTLNNSNQYTVIRNENHIRINNREGFRSNVFK